MSGTTPFSLSQQFDTLGRPLAGGKLYVIQAGTVGTPQNAFQDSALTIPWPNPIVLDEAGRLPQFFLDDGTIKFRLTDRNNVTQITADGIQVIGPSGGGGGGGGTVDATTVLATGDVKARYGTGTLSGFVRMNARTIGSVSSGATERANADTQALFDYLWNGDASLAVSSGRGASSAADWTANKNIALPDARGRNFAGLDDMGNVAAGRLSTPYFAGTPTSLGAVGGADRQGILAENLPPHTHGGTTSAETTPHTHNYTAYNTLGIGGQGGSTFFASVITGSTTAATTGESAVHIHSLTTDGGPGVTAAFGILSPMMLVTFYIKL